MAVVDRSPEPTPQAPSRIAMAIGCRVQSIWTRVAASVDGAGRSLAEWCSAAEDNAAAEDAEVRDAPGAVVCDRPAMRTSTGGDGAERDGPVRGPRERDTERSRGYRRGVQLPYRRSLLYQISRYKS
jgi:hypothetical protein